MNAMDPTKKALHHVKQAEKLLESGEADEELEEVQTAEPVQPTQQPSTASKLLDNDDVWLVFSIVIVIVMYAVWQMT